MSYSFEGITGVIFHNPLIPGPDVRLWVDGETGESPLKLIISHGGLDTNANTGQLECWLPLRMIEVGEFVLQLSLCHNIYYNQSTEPKYPMRTLDFYVYHI